MRLHMHPSLISEDLVVSGDLHSKGNTQIDGKLRGNVRARAITIGTSGSVDGKVIAEEVIVLGDNKGSIVAKSVTLGSTGRCEGIIAHHSLTVAFGAPLNARCHHVRFSAEYSENIASEIQPLTEQAPPAAMAAE